ncbi:MAG TPA: hypothetical protein VGK59_03185 [Ohtaekwangia sp.]
MKKEKAKTKRIGGFLLEILVLVFVFSYSYSWSETTLEDQSDRKGSEKQSAQIVLGNITNPVLKESIAKIKIGGAEFIKLNFTLCVTESISAISFLSCPLINLKCLNTTINAP